MKCTPSGPSNARIMLVGEAPGSEEDGKTPFLGQSGQELTRMLHDANIARADVFLTNVARYRPANNDISTFFEDSKLTRPGPQIREGMIELQREIASVKPNVIVALGNTPMWALTGNRGIVKWRGSILESTAMFGKVKVIPTYHPAAIMRQWDWRFIAVQDLRRVNQQSVFPEIRHPKYNFTIRPSYEAVVNQLGELIRRVDTSTLRLAGDIETRRSHTACFGIAWSRLDALCIPLMCVERPLGYWTIDQEFEIIKLLRTLLCHPNVQLVGQNFLYDNQYNARHWGFAPRVYMDTMLAHHVCWPGLPKGLDFLASMYNSFHRYWKDDGKHWNPDTPEEQLWSYNCTDCVATYEASEVLDRVIDGLKLRPQFEFQMKVFHAVFKMMLRGVRVDQPFRSKLATELMEMVFEREKQIQFLSGRTLNPRSPKQMASYFYETLKLPEQRNRKTGKRSCDDDSLKALAQKEPIVRRLVYSISETRSLANSLAVVQTPVGLDKRMRCSYNVGGTISFRFSSSEDAFGSGTNLQNVTVGKKSEETGLQLPNLRKQYIPDDGKVIVNVDLDRADLQVVVWEANDVELKQVLRDGLDIHLYNARTIYKLKFTDDDLKNPEAVSALKKEFYWKRHASKEFVHATDYYGKARTVSYLIGESVHQTEILQNNWLGAHPGIKQWWKRVEHDLMTKREVRNRFGNRIFFFDRIEGLLPDALAWVPQSTVALVINRGLVNLDTYCPDVDILLQVHDSLTLQIPQLDQPLTLSRIKPQLLITIPYDDPLTIPVGFSVSSKSWGDIKDVEV